MPLKNGNNLFLNWDLETEVSKARKEILSKKLTIREYHRVLRSFFNSMQDYHVKISFSSTEKVSLPFQVKGSQDRYFLVYIDRKLLPKNTFPFEVGDELISFNHQPTKDVVKRLMKELGPNTLETQHAIASLFLTLRSSDDFYEIPQGPVILEIKRKDSQKTQTYEAVWNYKKRGIDYSPVEKLHNQSYNTKLSFLSIFKDSMVTPEPFPLLSSKKPSKKPSKSKGTNTNPHFYGSITPFLPPLSEDIIYTAKDIKNFHNYIFEHKGRRVGYVRIPSYSKGGALSAQDFQQIINKFEKETDMLVIDQLHNVGGRAFYAYALLSMLSDRTLQAPLSRMSITAEDVVMATKAQEKFSSSSPEEALYGLKSTNMFHGYLIDEVFVENFKNYHSFILDQWSKSHFLTDPYARYVLRISILIQMDIIQSPF